MDPAEKNPVSTVLFSDERVSLLSASLRGFNQCLFIPIRLYTNPMTYWEIHTLLKVTDNFPSEKIFRNDKSQDDRVTYR